jgi:uncharacterized protein (DUF433 family)
MLEGTKTLAAIGLDRITFNPRVMGGKACIRGHRITVAQVLKLVASGMTTAEIIEEYDFLEADDISQALSYAAWLASETVHPLEVAEACGS